MQALATLVLSLCLATLAPFALAANTVEKFALVIGNGDYRDAARSLPNVSNDAALMAGTLRKLHFKVTERRDLDRSGLMSAVADFARGLPEGATAFVYYAGHGMQIGGANYLTPVDMTLTSEQSVPLNAYALKMLLEQLSAAKSAVNVVVLDACRNNPFQPNGAARYRSFANLGLAREEAPRGTLVAYATAPGQLAADGKGKNSLYTEALAQTLPEKHLTLEAIFKQVGTTVRQRTLDDQIPWFHTSLTDDYYFLPPEGVTVVAGKPLQMAKAGRSNTRARGDSPGTGSDWFRNLTDKDWKQLDWEIEQRVRRLTAEEIPYLEHQADGGSVVHQTTLGLVYRAGTDKLVDPAGGGVLRSNANNTQALRWLRRAAEAGFPIAQTELGEMYFTGHGTDRDVDAARRWFEQAAASGYPRARINLAKLDAGPDAPTATAPEPFKQIRSDGECVREAQAKGVHPTDLVEFVQACIRGESPKVVARKSPNDCIQEGVKMRLKGMELADYAKKCYGGGGLK
jgi:hypothetical protein